MFYAKCSSWANICFARKVSHSTAVRSVRIKYSNVKKPQNATSHAHFFNFSQVSFIFLIYVSLFTQILALYLITPCLCLSLFLKRKLQANSQDPIPTYIFLAPGLLCFDQISQFLKKFPILTKFHNFDQIWQFWPNFTIVEYLKFLEYLELGQSRNFCDVFNVQCTATA